MGRLGLEDVATREIPSPYDFDSCARIYLPRGLPAPESPGYTAAVVEIVRQLLEAAGAVGVNESSNLLVFSGFSGGFRSGFRDGGQWIERQQTRTASYGLNKTATIHG